MDNKEPRIKKVVGLDIKVLCDDDKKRIVSIHDMGNTEKSTMTFNRDEAKSPKLEIAINLFCDKYSLSIKEDEATQPVYVPYIPEKYRMPDFMKPVEITCDTKNPYTIKDTPNPNYIPPSSVKK